MQIPPERLDQIAHRFAELEARMASGTLEGEAFVRASRDYAELEPVAKIAAQVKAAREEMAGLTEMLADPEMKAMAEEELSALKSTLPELERRLEESCAQNVADNYLVPALSQEVDDLKARNAELESDIIEYRESITSIDEMNHNLTRHIVEERKRNAELVEALIKIDGAICSFCIGELCFKLRVENQSGVYRMCDRREILQTAIRAGRDV